MERLPLRMHLCLCVCVSQGRSLRESTLRRAQRRSFTPASFMEEDMVDFPDELDTSFFARVRQNKQQSLLLLCILVFSKTHEITNF